MFAQSLSRLSLPPLFFFSIQTFYENAGDVQPLLTSDVYPSLTKKALLGVDTVQDVYHTHVDVWPFPVHYLIGPQQVQPLGKYSFTISSLLILLLPFKARNPTFLNSNPNLFPFLYKTLSSSLLLGPTISLKNFSKSQLSPVSPAINLQCVRRCCFTSCLLKFTRCSKAFLLSFHFVSSFVYSMYHKHVS